MNSLLHVALLTCCYFESMIKLLPLPYNVVHDTISAMSRWTNKVLHSDTSEADDSENETGTSRERNGKSRDENEMSRKNVLLNVDQRNGKTRYVTI